MLTVRPKIAELVFQLYGRPLHPELFEVHQTSTVERNGYSAKIDITSAGHVVTWRYDGMTLAEVCAAANHPLPRKRRLISYAVRGTRRDRLECRGGVNYRMDVKSQTVDPSVFWAYQEEMAHDQNRQGMLQTFGASGRLAVGALSYVNVQSRDRELRIRVVHTFPDDYALVSCESYFNLP